MGRMGARLADGISAAVRARGQAGGNGELVQRRALLDRGDWAEEEPRRENADAEDAGEEGGPLFLTEKRGVGHEKIQETKRHRFELIGCTALTLTEPSLNRK
jgi:hypothetical protein